MSKQGAEMRSGAVDFGRLYEQRIATYLAVKYALDPEVSDFWLLSNVAYFGAFDDIILMVQDQTGSKSLYCIQLKHTENKNNLSVALLEQKASKKNKYGLSKYQDSFETIQENMKKNKDDLLKGISLEQVYFILWTNGPLEFKDKLQGITVESVGGMEFINTSTASNVYKVKNLPTSEAPFDETFLSQFYLFAKQVSATSLERMIKDKLSTEFKDVNNSTIIAITDYFTKWSMGQGKTMQRITKSDIQRSLLEFMFLPHLVEPNVMEDVDFDKFDLLNETLTSFNITPISEFTFLANVFSSIKYILNRLCGSHLNLQLSWNTDLSPTHWNAIKAIEDDVTKRVVNTLRERTMFVPRATIRDVYLAAWHCRLIPLVVNCTVSENFIETILVKFKNVTKNLSFILLNPNKSILTDHLKVFGSLNSIENSALKERNLNESFVSLQGKKKINMETFRHNNELLEEVTPDVYVRIMQGVIQVGETIEVENYYIKRDLRRPLLNLSVLSESSISKDREYMFNNSGDIFILVEYTHNSLPLKYRKNSIDLVNYLTEEDCKEDEKLYILHTDLGDLDQTVISAAASLHNETKKSIHVMRLNAGFLEWSFSKGTVVALQQHLVQSSLLKEEDSEYNILEDEILKYSRSNINIISNNAGMGKTFMLHSIANKFEPEEWVSYVNLSEHITKFPHEGTFSFFLKYLLECNLKNTQKYMQKFFTHIYVHCLKTGKIVCLFDGYDEVSSAHAISFLTEAKNGGLRMWITTRPTYTIMLERSMENLSVEITHFSTEDHVTFLWKYFHSYYDVYKYDDNQIQHVIDAIGRCSSNLDKSLIAQPLQTRMFAEIFGDDISQISEKEKLTIVDLYNKFVDVKLKEYKSYEATSLKKTLSKLALKLFFTQEQLEDVLDFEDLAEEAVTFQESYKKDSIVIGLNETGEAVFGHRTFAEFLAAFWLAKQIVNRKGQYNLPWLPILEKLYYIEMIPVRIFFDRILSQNLPLHIAILNNDMENIHSLLEAKEFGKDLDALGRSALHIAVTYGKYYDLYVAEEVKGLKDVGSHSFLQINNTNCKLRIREQDQYQISNEIVETLLSRGFKNTTDLFLRYDLFDYAMKSCSLNFVNILFKRYDKANLHFEIGFSFEIFLCCIVKDNLHNILSNRKVYNFDAVLEHKNELRNIFKGYNSKLLTMKYNDMYLTEIAAFFGAKETLFDLLQSGCLQLENGNIVHKACFNGQDGILDLVHKMGADIDRFDESNWSPLYQAATRKRDDIIYHMLKNYADVMTKSSATKMTPMHYSVQGGHLECTKKLIEYGAKINTKVAYGNTPLSYACQYGHSDIIDLFFKSGHLDISETAVKSAINVATFHGNTDSVSKLLEYGLDVNNIDNNGDTPLVLASKKGFSDIVSVLANSKCCNMNLMVKNESMASLQMYCAGHSHIMLHTKLFLLKCDRNKLGGVTALHFAARHGHVDCAKTLVDLATDKHMEDEITKYPPIVWAAMYGFERIIKVLLSTGREENEDFMQTVHEAHLCLIWASMVGHEKCVEVLCEYLKELELETAVNEEKEPRIKAIISAEFGLDLWFVRENENLPLLLAAKNGCSAVIRTLLSMKYRQNHGLDEALHWAARNGHLECVKELILSGADDNNKNEKRLPLLPIVWASMYSRTDVVEYLLSNKTRDYLQNKDLHFALNYAALGGHHECVKLLLDFGLDVDNVDQDLNGTPLICACLYSGTTQVIDALLERKCAVNVKNSDGLTALDIAAKKNNFEFVKRFINSGVFKDLVVDEQSDLYKNLQLALDGAIGKEEYGLIEKLIEMGIKAP